MFNDNKVIKDHDIIITLGVLALDRHNNLAGLNPLIIIIIIITLLSLNIYKQTIVHAKR
jgi:hypothetical protein